MLFLRRSLILAFALPLCGWGQEANYKLADKFLMTRMKDVVFSRDVTPNFVKGSDNFWFTYKTGQGKVYYYVEPSHGKVSPLFDHAAMAGQLNRYKSRPVDPKDMTINPMFSPDGRRFIFHADTVALEYTLATGVFRRIERGKRVAQTPNLHYSVSPDSSLMAFALRHDVWVKSFGAPDSSAVQATRDGAAGFSYADDPGGQTVRLFTTRARWFKNSRKLYVLREDTRKQRKLQLISGLDDVRKTQEFLYEMPGDKDVMQYDLTIIDPVRCQPLKVDIARWSDQHVRVLYDSKDGRRLYIQRMRRGYDEIEICEVDAETGALKVLINEKVKPRYNEKLFSVGFIGDGEELLLWSDRTGWGHYYLYDRNGNLKRQLTSGEWNAGATVRIDEKDRTLCFTGYGREQGVNPYYEMLYRVSLDGKSPVRLLTPEPANHGVAFSPSGNYFVDNYSRVDLAPVSVLRNRDGRVVCALGRADLTRLYGMGWRMPETFMVKAADGVTDLYGTMWKPYDFDSTKRYPVISYVYPGPTTEALALNFTTTGNYNADLAQVGFIVVHFGHRGGTQVRNKAYNTYGYGNLRDYALADDKYGLEQLADRHAFIDIGRVGIFGHSGGGFMAVAALCTYPDFYKAAIASSGNHDNRIYHRRWGELFQGVKEVRGTGKDTSVTFKVDLPTNMELAGRMKGHLLLVTGDADENVHAAHTYRMADALLRAGKNFEMYVFPGQKHLYRDHADLFFRRKVWYFFGKHLLGDFSAERYTDMDGFND